MPIPPAFLLNPDRPDDLVGFLRARGWLADQDEVTSIAPAGDGNMNCTLRVITAGRRLIVKQGRPWVEKYPDIPAPPDRTLVEGWFYSLVRDMPEVARRMPRLVGLDPESRILALEDCQGSRDLTDLYDGAALDESVLAELLGFLGALHRLAVPHEARARFGNHEMRALNHEHIFRLPLAADASLLERLDAITPGLASLAERLSTDDTYSTRVAALGELYLRGHPRALVHGDFFPGSWLAGDGRVYVIDPEFCFLGAPEFDLGVLVAHLILADQPASALAQAERASVALGVDTRLVEGFAGAEIMRRLIGVGQLPRLQRSLDQKRALLETSRRLVLGVSRPS